MLICNTIVCVRWLYVFHNLLLLKTIKLESHHIHDCIMLISNVQKETVG